MSVKVMGWVWDADLPPNLKLVLLAYADAAEHDGTEIWPGRDRLAHMTGYSRSQIERNTRQLIDLGLLVREQRGQKGRRAKFSIPLDSVSQYAPLSETVSVASDEVSVASEADSVSHPRDPSHPTDPSTTPVLQIAATPRNHYWDALVILFGDPTNGQRSLYGRFVAMVKDRGHLPGEIPTRAALLAALWGPEKVTVASLEKHWPRFDGEIGQITQADVDSFVEKQRRAAMIERLHDDA